MDKRIAGLLGAAAALTTMSAAQSAVAAPTQITPPSYRDLDVKYEKTHSTYWYVVDNADRFEPQDKQRQVQIGVCSSPENSKAIRNEGFSYEYHYKTKQGLAVADFEITTCP